jgi:hypothetical protein
MCCYITLDPETRASEKRNLFNSNNVPYNDLFLQRLYEKKMKVIKMKSFYHVLNNICFPMKRKPIISNLVLVCMRSGIHRCVKAS